ncbi:hypothetical protein [Vibrio comitans]|uniref:hypothetical protein n=1 Tax=Vibrio comitans TaxID=413401 RepID=UPI0035EEE49C
MSELAKDLNLDYKYENKIMFGKSRVSISGVKQALYNLFKASPLPPLEWIVNYKLITGKDLSEYDLIVESGSKVIRTKVNYISYVENAIGLFGFNSKKINKINWYLFTQLIKKSNFKGFVFYSKASRTATMNLFMKFNSLSLFKDLDLGIIYPYAKVPKFKKNSDILLPPKNEFKALFCSSSLVLKGGLETIVAIEELSSEHDIELICITNGNISRTYANTEFVKFSSDREKYESIIANCDIIIHPTFLIHMLFPY